MEMIIELALGATIGVIMALTGAGGGILAVPLLVFAVGLSVPEAAPIGLLAVGIAAALGAVLGLKAGTVRYRAALLMATTGMAFAPAGVWIGSQVDSQWLTGLFALVLLFVSLRTYRQATAKPEDRDEDARPLPPCVVSEDTGRFVWTTRCARALAGSGGVAGLLSGLLGVGGGFVMVPAMTKFTDLAMQSIIATSLAVIALVSVSGVATNALAGSLNWSVAIPFSAGALAGMLIGRGLSAHITGPALQKGFALVSAAVAVGMLVKIFPGNFLP